MQSKTAEKLMAKLPTGVVAFAFKKANGDIRYAAGTHNLSIIPADKQPKNLTKSHETKTNISYFDICKQNWRSLKKENIIRIATTITE